MYNEETFEHVWKGKNILYVKQQNREKQKGYQTSYFFLTAAIGNCCFDANVDGLVQERHDSSVLAMELHLSCTNPSI